MTIDLKYPIKTKLAEGGVAEIKQVTVGRIKVRDLKQIPKGILGGGSKRSSDPLEYLPLISSVCCLSPEVTEQLDIIDLNIIIGELVQRLGE